MQHRVLNEFSIFEKEILQHARLVTRNPRLAEQDIREWAIGEVKPRRDEVVIRLHGLDCTICILKRNDKRGSVKQRQNRG